MSTTGPVTHVSKGCATLWTGLVCVYGHETLVCACLVAGRPCLEPAVPDVETNWCTNDTWARRVWSEKTKCGTWSSFYSLPFGELEFNKIGSTGREIGEVFKSGSTGIQDNQCYRSGDLWIAVGDVGRLQLR